MNRRSQTPYFPQEDGAPPPLTAEAGRQVRFEEVDSLGIVWHGHYPSYLEDGRAAFGREYGLDYLSMHKHGCLAPVVQMHLEYHQPLAFPEQCTISASLYWTEAARLNYQYTIVGPENRIVATGYTVQLITDLDKNVMLTRPEFFEYFWRRWEAGELPGPTDE
jgi:acyl-CoA thioester hydrolase